MHWNAIVGWSAAGWLAAVEVGLAAAGSAFSVDGYGAAADGATLDTAAIQRAIDACAAAGGGQVRLPPGRYLSGTIHLRSDVALLLDAGARLVGSPDLAQYQQPTPPEFMPEARWGKWHRGLIVGDGVEDVTIAGPGIIDGNRVFDPDGEEKMRGPHTLVLADCRRVTIRDLSFADSANYAVFFQACDDVEVRDVEFTGGWDGVHFRGAPDRPCRRVRILDCRFFTGDDAIAGRYWEDTLISGCIVNSSCNGIRLIGPASRLTIHDCLFYGPGAYPHRTSDRSNMLTGILLQPGAWDATRGVLDDVLISDVTMRRIASPVNVWLKPGNRAGRITVARLTATGAYRSALSFESFAEEPIESVVLRDVAAEFDGGGTREQAAAPVPASGVDARALPAWGLYARGVDRFCLESVRLSATTGDKRPAARFEEVRQLAVDDFRYTRSEDVPEGVLLIGVDAVQRAAETFRGTTAAPAPPGVDEAAPASRVPAVDRLDQLVPECMGSFHVPGVAIVGVADRRIAWERYYGVRRAGAPAPVDRETVFEACSMSKVPLAYWALKLQERGLLDLDRPLRAYLDQPYLPDEPLHERITARMVLTHTTGFPNWREGGWQSDQPLRLLFEPGTKFGYSGEGFLYLQRVVERLAGAPLESAIRPALFDPLGISSASYVWEDRFEQLAAAGHDAAGAPKEGRPLYRQANAGYSLYCTAHEYARFLVEIVRLDRSAAHSLSARALDAMLTPVVEAEGRTAVVRAGFPDPGTACWGLGWAIDRTPRGNRVYHGGANGTGFRCYCELDRDAGTGLVIMTNAIGGRALWERVMSELGMP